MVIELRTAFHRVPAQLAQPSKTQIRTGCSNRVDQDKGSKGLARAVDANVGLGDVGGHTEVFDPQVLDLNLVTIIQEDKQPEQWPS